MDSYHLTFLWEGLKSGKTTLLSWYITAFSLLNENILLIKISSSQESWQGINGIKVFFLFVCDVFFVELFVLFMYCFANSFSCLFVCSCSCWTSLRGLFWILWQFTDLRFPRVGYWSFISSFGSTMCTWFPRSLLHYFGIHTFQQAVFFSTLYRFTGLLR